MSPNAIHALWLLLLLPVVKIGWGKVQDWGDERHARRQRNERRF